VLGLKWSNQALEDVEVITDYIEQRNPLAAKKMRGIFKKGAERLTVIPYAFRPGLVAGTREYVVHENYIIVYRVDVDLVEILRVMHAKQKYPPLSDEPDE